MNKEICISSLSFQRAVGNAKGTEVLIAIKGCRPRCAYIMGLLITHLKYDRGSCNLLIGQFKCLIFGFSHIFKEGIKEDDCCSVSFSELFSL